MIPVTAALIQNSKSQILLARKKPGKSLAELWEFPGGKIEEGETPEECLKREIFEEFGMNITIDRYFITNRYQYPNVEIELICYLASTDEDPQHLTDHDGWEWVERSRLMEYELAGADVAVAEELGSRL